MSSPSALGYGYSYSHLHWNLAVTFIGISLNGPLFGVLVGQIGFYLHHSSRDDRMLIRSLVFVLLILNSLHKVFLIYTVYIFFISGRSITYNDEQLAISTMPWSAYATIIWNSVCVLFIHIFYIHRVWLIGRSIIATAILASLSVVTFCGGTLLFVYTLLSTSTWEWVTRIYLIETVISAAYVLTDIGLTSSLLFLLVRSGKDAPNGPNRLVKRLIFYTISTGVFTCVCALLGLITIIVLPDTILSQMFWYLGTSLYSISLMASLNAREGLRAKFVENSEFPTSASATMPHFTTVCMDDIPTSIITGNYIASMTSALPEDSRVSSRSPETVVPSCLKV